MNKINEMLENMERTITTLNNNIIALEKEMEKDDINKEEIKKEIKYKENLRLQVIKDKAKIKQLCWTYNINYK